MNGLVHKANLKINKFCTLTKLQIIRNVHHFDLVRILKTRFNREKFLYH